MTAVVYKKDGTIEPVSMCVGLLTKDEKFYVAKIGGRLKWYKMEEVLRVELPDFAAA